MAVMPEDVHKYCRPKSKVGKGEAFRKSHGGEAPKELFIHGKTRFSKEEWEGFRETVPPETNVVCVRIREDSGMKLFRRGPSNIARGLAWIKPEEQGYLWSKGYVPRRQTYARREVPGPLEAEFSPGFDDNVQRSVRENCDQLKFKNKSFD